MKHYLRTQCRSDLNGCGGEWTASFRLPADWAKNGTEKGLWNLDGECTDCEEAWRLSQLMPEMEKYYGPARPEALKPLTVIQRTSKEVGMKAVDVFISHAGPDKWTIASPLFDKLRGEGFSCFLDKKSMKAGDCASEEMIAAMESAKIGVFILSPEFAARRWPMKELRCFLRRYRDAQSSGATLPILIPVFYRLRISECRSFKPEQYVDENGRDLFEAEKFYTEERQNEATMAMVKDELREVTTLLGIENEAASNDVLDPLASGFRKMLVERIVYSVKEAREARQQQEAKGVGIPQTGREGDCSTVPKGSDGLRFPKWRIAGRLLAYSAVVFTMAYSAVVFTNLFCFSCNE
ncbi:TIR domain-containing protein [Chondrus crispus]|uniref:ADP-ribosyl cyclase/cyclic ADP-ribose hydrolase n=1 Tax=Chondrus crispus TaxID=2769 RepID=R7QR54_CHOCR|nr:TIR domain-containing protein [Chondrus crispus]CDF40243.1 TIR domain-containing protein [Chondrus crispus]|eukprot:XP_005710537.1 TIR domain-containing protein [Chondrus crispus]